MYKVSASRRGMVFNVGLYHWFGTRTAHFCAGDHHQWVSSSWMACTRSV